MRPLPPVQSCPRPLADGCEITVVSRVTLGDLDAAAYGMEATLDGGIREVRGLRVGGVGAVLWCMDTRSGLRRRVGAATMALPWVADSQVAEAWGEHLAMLLLMERSDGDRRIRICGDSLAVVWHCAAQGRLHRPCAQAILEPVLARLATGGWRVTWQAIRRRLNMVADAEATEGIFGARQIRDEGGAARCWRVRWFG